MSVTRFAYHFLHAILAFPYSVDVFSGRLSYVVVSSFLRSLIMLLFVSRFFKVILVYDMAIFFLETTKHLYECFFQGNCFCLSLSLSLW